MSPNSRIRRNELDGIVLKAQTPQQATEGHLLRSTEGEFLLGTPDSYAVIPVVSAPGQGQIPQYDMATKKWVPTSVTSSRAVSGLFQVTDWTVDQTDGYSKLTIAHNLDSQAVSVEVYDTDSGTPKSTTVEVWPVTNSSVELHVAIGAEFGGVYVIDLISSGTAVSPAAPTASIVSPVAAEDLTKGQICYIGNDGLARKAASSLETSLLMRTAGFALDSVAAGARVDVQQSGQMMGVLTGLTPGAFYYLTTTPGEISKDNGDSKATIGYALSANQLVVLTQTCVDWNFITNPPTSLPPGPHTHAQSDVIGLTAALAEKADLIHTHHVADIVDLQLDLSEKSDVGHVHAISEVTGLQLVLNTKTDVGHTHVIGDTLGLQDALNGKAALVHVHSLADVVGLQAALAEKADTIHVHSITDVTGLQDALSQKPTLDVNQKIPDAFLKDVGPDNVIYTRVQIDSKGRVISGSAPTTFAGLGISETTSNLPEGTNLYFLNSRVLAAPLTGFQPTGGTTSAGDSVLQALQKHEYRLLHDVPFSAITGKPASLEDYGIEDAVNLSQMGAPNGVASLDTNGKVPTTQLPAAILGSLNYQGTWNAATNVPEIPPAAEANRGFYYKVATAGTTVVGSISDWQVGDWIVSDGSTWDRVNNTDKVMSVAGKTGDVQLSTNDVSEGTSLYFTNARVLAATLTGFVASDGSAALQTDSVVKVLQKHEYRLNNLISGVSSFNTRGGAVTLTSDDVRSALGYTPVNKAGGTVSGDLIVTNNAANANFTIMASSGYTGGLNLGAADVIRASLELDAAGRTLLNSYDAQGILIDSTVQINNVLNGLVTITRPLTLNGFYLALTQSSGAQRFLLGNQDNAGMNTPCILQALDGVLEIGWGTSWVGDGGIFTVGVSFTNAQAVFQMPLTAPSVNGITGLSNGQPQNLGTADPGSSSDAAHADHIHQAPSVSTPMRFFYENALSTTDVQPIFIVDVPLLVRAIKWIRADNSPLTGGATIQIKVSNVVIWTVVISQDAPAREIVTAFDSLTHSLAEGDFVELVVTQGDPGLKQLSLHLSVEQLSYVG
jgi:hypothetical protein